jgi:hypothetical protein
MTALTQTADRLAKPPTHSGAIRVRMAPHLLDAISDAAGQRGMTASAWLREAATTLASLEGTLTTTASRGAGELYDRVEGRQRFARIEGDQIKGIGYHAEKPEAPGKVYVPVVHEDSEPFDISWHWRLKPHFRIEADRVICTYPVVLKSLEHA